MLHHIRPILPILLAAICSAAPAAWVSKSGDKLPETSFRKSSGELIAQILFVGDDAELFRVWNTPSESVNVQEIEEVRINSPISTFIVFGGCKPDSRGNCDVAMRFKVVGPDGKVYSETPAMEVWRSRPKPPNRALQLSVDYLKIVVEPHELRGKYIVNAEVRDNNSGAQVTLQRTFLVIDRP